MEETFVLEISVGRRTTENEMMFGKNKYSEFGLRYLLASWDLGGGL